VQTVKATVVLHNFILKNCNKDDCFVNTSATYHTEDVINTSVAWEMENSNFDQLTHVAGNRSGTKAAKDQRDLLAQSMVMDNLAPWQFEHAFRST